MNALYANKKTERFGEKFKISDVKGMDRKKKR
jgi:hypothetical protein